MKLKRVLIADDESPARSLLSEYLKAYDQLELISVCADGLSATAEINYLRPDIVFLDVQMPGRTGIEIAALLEYCPAIIFCTAWEEYAIQAFELDAVDYLLKPYTKARLEKAIARVLTRMSSPNHDDGLHEDGKLERYARTITATIGRRVFELPVENILWIEAYGDYTRLHTAAEIFLSNKSMQSLETLLDPAMFRRVHRSAIIADNAIKGICRQSSRLHLILSNGKRLQVSRSYQHIIDKGFSGM